MKKIYEDEQVEILEPDIPNTSYGVEQLIHEFHERLRDVAQKMSVADYIRLLQLQRELHSDEPRDIEVTWIESSTAPNRKLEGNSDAGSDKFYDED